MQTLFMESAVRATLIAAVIALVLFAMRIKTAAVLHAVWSSVVVLMMLLPAWVAWGPKASLPVLPSATMAPLDFVPLPSPAGLVQHSSIGSASPVRQDGGFPLHATTTVYLFGLFILLLRLAIGTIRASRLTSASCVVPVTVGLLHPRIILPECAREWPQAQLEAVLAHEGEHIRRRDPLFQWIALLNRALFWFHPLAWWLERKLSGLAEEVCDAAVIARGYDPREYSEYLLDLARSVERVGTRIDAVGMAMPGIGLKHRIRQMLSGVPVPRISRPRMTCAMAVCAAAAVILATGTLVRAQVPKLAFEVASIKPILDQLRGHGPGIRPSPDGLAARATLRDLVLWAYGVKEFQITGGPGWLDSQWYDIQAKAGHSVSRDQIMQMLQALLAERFKLEVHRETRVLAIYALVVGKSGPKLHGVPPGDKLHGQIRFAMSGKAMQLTGEKAPMSELAIWLTSILLDTHRPVLDKTGLTGTFDFKLAWTPEQDFPATAVEAALQEQLGLKLESTKGPVDVLVIDSAEKPSEN